MAFREDPPSGCEKGCFEVMLVIACIAGVIFAASIMFTAATLMETGP